MPRPVASELLRPGLLEGVSVFLVAAAPEVAQPETAGEDAAGDRLAGDDLAGEELAAAVESACTGLGARVWSWRAVLGAPEAEPSISERAADEAVAGALAAAESIEVAVVDAASLFARAWSGEARDRRQGARAALMVSLEATWNVTRALVNVALLPKQAGGRIVYLAPASASHEHADAARAGLENLARTLSIEWARYAITAVSILPGRATSAGEVASLVAYLASPGGAYFSGCRLDLGGLGV
jgi:NAD(P)-dependent dehydrogenase (short-subunit alcohol dehydrogenase family)